MPNQQKPELIELLINSEIILTANDDYVNVINPERPQGFAEHFAQLLSRTPNIHSPNKPEFFPHLFLGSVAALPYTDLMSKLKIEKIFFDIKKKKGSLKLVFKIKDQTGYKLKLFIVTDNKSAVSFTDQELSDIKSKTSDSKNLVADAPTQIEYHVLRILKDDGFKLQVSSEDISEKFGAVEKAAETKETVGFREITKIDQEIQQFGPLVDKLSAAEPEDVKVSFEAILKSLKNLYIGQKDKLAALKSEAAYHGFIHGFFALNYKYTNGLYCYSEQVSGPGYLDFRILSRHDSKGQVNSNPFSITLEMKDGAGAESGIAQLKDSGYAYISPNVRTEAEKVIIAALDWSKEDNVQDLKVEIVDVHKVKESLVARLIDDIQHGESTGDIVRNIREQMKSLYYSFSLKHKDSQYCSRVLVGQSISLEKQGIESYLFQYPGTITGGAVTTLLYKDEKRGIALNILEVQETSQQIALHIDGDARTRPKPGQPKASSQPDWYMIPVQGLGIDDFITLQIVVNTNAASFEKKKGKQGYIESINLLKVKIDAIDPLHQGDFVPLSKVAVSDIIFSMFDHPVTNVDENLPTASKRMKLGEVEKKQEKHQKVDVEKMLKQCFANLDSLIIRESDVQAILHGFLLGQKYLDQHIRVFIEQSYGPGKSDVVAFIPDKHNSREEKVLLFETKICKLRSSTALQELFVKATLQLSEYQQHLKSSTDSKKVSVIPLIYNRADKAVYVHQFNGVIDHTSHSSSAEQGPSTNNQNYKQGNKSVIVSPKILSEMFEKGIFDFSKYHLDKIDYILLKNFLINHRPATQGKITCVLNLSNQRNIIDNMYIVAEILQHDLWISDLIMKNCDLNNDALTRLTDALISKERLEVAMNGSPAQKAYLSYLSQDTSSGGLKVLGLRVLDLSDNVISVQCCEILSRALSQMLSLKNFAASHLENGGLRHISNGLMQITTLSSLKIVEVEGGLDTERAQGLVALFDQHPNLKKLYASHNSMGQSNIDIILHGAQKKGRKFKVCDLSYNKKDAQEVINTESLKSFISFYKETLKTLQWKDNGLGDQELNALSASFQESKIEVLDLSHNKITVIDGDKLPKTLTSLIVHHNKIVVFTRGQLNHLENLSGTLDVTYNTKLTNVCDVMNLAIAAHTKHLGLSGIDFGDDANVAAFNELWRHGEDLTSLSVPNCNIDDKQVKILFNILELSIAGGATKLKKLNCENNHIEINDKSVISGKPSFYDETGFIVFSDSIEEVSFKGNKIGDEGGKHLLDALHARSKEFGAREHRGATTEISIDLSDNKLTDVFAQDLANALPSLKGLKSMKLRGCSFTERYKNQLVNAVGDNGNTDVTSLEIDHLSSDEQRRLDSYLTRNTYTASSTLALRLNGDDEFQVVNCLNGGRGKRFISGCKISWDEVDEISREKTRDKEKIVIDVEKFLKYSKQHVDDIEKSKQLISLANEIKRADSERIVGDYKNVLDKVIEVGSYKQYVESDRINYLGSQALRDKNIMPKLQATLVNGIGRIQMGYGAYGTFVSCKQAGDRQSDLDSNLDCILGVTEIGYSSLSRTIEQKISGKIAKHVVAHKILGGPLARNFAGTIAKGAVEIGGAAFDIADIIRSSIALSKCNDQASSESACSEKEIRDNIASITFSSISVISGIGLLVAGAGGVLSVGVGAVIFVVRMIYGGVSNVVEYGQKYHTTDAENWSIFWRTVFFQDMSSDVKALSGRQDNIDMAVDNAWRILQNASEEIVGISLGLGPEDLEYVNECVRKLSIYIKLNSLISIKLDDTAIHIQLKPPSDTNQLLPFLLPIPNPNNVQCTQYTRFDFKPSYSRIDMSHKDDHILLSRVQPHKIANAQFVCLPKMTKAEYEKGLSKLNTEAVFKCDNAAVVLHKQRAAMKSTDPNKKQTVLHYLKDIISGSVVGSLEYNNYFLIFGGNTSIFAPSVPYNVFKLLQKDYHGTIHLSTNSTNVVDLSGFESIQHVKVEYTNIVLLTMQMLITIDVTTSHFDALEKGVAIRYVGGEKTLDTITCNVESYNRQDSVDSTIVIDSGGVIRNIAGWRDLITNCRTVVLSPNTIVQGTGGGYSIYVNKVNNKIGLFDSVINIPDGAKIVFAISLFEDCEKIEYSALDNNLNIYIPLPEGGEYNVSLSQYMIEGKTTNYVLMDQNGVRIIPSLDLSNTVVQNFILRKDIEENFTAQLAIDSYRNNISYKGKGYNISGILVYKEDAVCMFGSIADDLIIENDNIVLMIGGEGRDQYTINNKKKDELYIYNYAEDLELDVLTIPSIKDLMVRVHSAGVELCFASKKITLYDYLLDRAYQHIVITDHELKTVIPLYEGNKMSLQPFYYPLDSKKNVYVLSNDNISGVIGIHSKDIVLYQQGNNLLITDKDKSFGILTIILENYYIKDARLKNITLRSYDDGAVGDIIDLKSIIPSHTDTHISNVYGDLVQEYIVDLQKQSSVIAHNNELSTGMIVLQNTSLDDLSVIYDNSNDLILHNSLSNNSMILEDWYVSDVHRVSAFEFDTGITPIRVWVSDSFQIRIYLNHQINTEILKMDALIVKEVLSFVTAYNKSLQRPACSFLEEELSKFGGGIQSVVDIKRSLASADDMSGKVLMLLVAKFVNKMLLEDPNMGKEEIYEFADVCFDAVVNSTDIKDIVQLVNDSIVYYYIGSAVDSMKHKVQESMLNLPFTVNNNEELISHRRDTRDVVERTEDYYGMPYSVDKNDSRSFIESTYWFKEHIENMTSG